MLAISVVLIVFPNYIEETPNAKLSRRSVSRNPTFTGFDVSGYVISLRSISQPDLGSPRELQSAAEIDRKNFAAEGRQINRFVEHFQHRYNVYT